MEQEVITGLQADLASLEQQLDEQREEGSGEEGLLAEVIEGEGEKQKITAKGIKSRLKKIGKETAYADECVALEGYAALLQRQADARAAIKVAEDALEGKVVGRYLTLTEDEVNTLVVEDQWLATLAGAVGGELDRVSHTLTGRLRELAERYALPLPQIEAEVAELSARVESHLVTMGAVWR